MLFIVCCYVDFLKALNVYDVVYLIHRFCPMFNIKLYFVVCFLEQQVV